MVFTLLESRRLDVDDSSAPSALKPKKAKLEYYRFLVRTSVRASTKESKKQKKAKKAKYEPLYEISIYSPHDPSPRTIA